MLKRKSSNFSKVWSKGCFFTLASMAVLLNAPVLAVDENYENSEEFMAAVGEEAKEVAEAVTIAFEEVASNVEAQGEEAIDVAKVSEAFGHLIVSNLENPGFHFDMEAIIKGMRDAMDGKASPMSELQYEKAISTIQEKIFSEMAAKNLHDAEDFMNRNAHENGVVVVDEGKLHYRIEQEGNGKEVPEDGMPLINYTGKYLDGTVFGSSLDNGAPITLPLDRTIPGFRKGLVGMKEGEKRTLYIHPEMGYGMSGHLPPNSLLVFEIEILEANRDMKSAEDVATVTTQEDCTDNCR